MSQNIYYSMATVISLLPSIGLAFKRPQYGRDVMYWCILAVAIAGPLSLVISRSAGNWSGSLSMTIWVTIAVSMLFFAGLAAFSREGWRLTPLISSYMVILGLLAIAWDYSQQIPRSVELGTLVIVHISVSVATYALVTMAAIAALAAILQERSIKTKNPTALTAILPSVADCDHLLVRLLIIGQCVLAIGLATGMGVEYIEHQKLLILDHKTILTILSFVLIGGLLIAHFRSGVRGRKAARIVLIAYLCLTLGYPGVKFVTDILLM